MDRTWRDTKGHRNGKQCSVPGAVHRLRLLLPCMVSVTMTASLLFCTDDYNPFTDVRNARAYLDASFSDGDTVSIFSTETLAVVLAVKELIDTFSLSAEANRYFSDTLVANGSSEWPEGKTVMYPVSFYDTGWQEIRCRTRRSGGEEVVERFSCYVRSPLRQAPLIDTLGIPVCLSTEPVKDRDVVYFWSFGGGMVVQSVPHSVCRKIPVNGISTVGKLWVAELNGKYASPPTPFSYSMFDEEGPVITCLNEGAVGKDTVVTGSTEMYLQVHIVDGSGRIFNATVNGKPFDIIRDRIYLKAIISGGFPIQPELFTVRAYDPFSNLTEKKLWVMYDSTAEENAAARITFIVPSTDTLVVAKKQWIVYGRVDIPGTDSFSLAMECSVNDIALSQRQQVRSVAGADWSFAVELDEGRSVVSVRAYDNSETVVAEGKRILIYDNDMQQTNPPVIVELLVDRRVVDNNPVTVDSSVAELRIIAFDERSEIARVRCNGRPVPSGENGEGCIWETTVTAAHAAEGSRQILYLENDAGLLTYDTLFIRQNRDPIVTWYPQPPLPLQVGTLYVDTIFAIDPEGDPVRYKKSGGSPTLVVDSVSGRISWQPTAGDIGTDTVAITISDPFGALLYSFPVLTIDSSDVPDNIQFVTTEDNFPVVLQASRDTMRVVLQVVPGTGKDPFTFSVRIHRHTANIPVMKNDTVQWTPQLSDTGTSMFTITVTDSFGNTAELFPNILVVPPNRPFTLSSRWTGDTSVQGTLLMYGVTAAETLLVTVHDPDTGIADTIRAQVTINGSMTVPVPVIDRKVDIPLAPRADYTGLDTLLLRIEDRTGNAEEVRFFVYYGAPPSIPELLRPAADSVVRDSSVQFEWRTDDPDGSPLTHVLYLAAGDTVFSAVAEVQDEDTCTIENLVRAGRYFWRIRSSDGAVAAASALQAFYLDPPWRIRFSSGEEEIPAVLMAQTDTLQLALQLTEGTGRAPYTISVDGTPSTLTKVDGMTVRWTPQLADTGTFRFVVVVRDAVGNSDTLSRILQVVPPNAPPVLALAHTVATTPDGALDLSSGTGSEVLVFTVEDTDPRNVEYYTFHSLLRHAERIDDRGSGRTFTVTVDPEEHPDQWFDTLTVWVEDREGAADTIQVVLFYGYFLVTPRFPEPADNSINENSLVTVRWSPAAPNTANHRYTVFLGTTAASLIPIVSTTDTMVTVGSLINGVQYFWRVSVTDGMDTVEGPVWTFFNRIVDAVVTFNTTASGVTLEEDVAGVPLMLRLDTSIITNLGGSVDLQPGGFLFMNARGDTLPYNIDRWNMGAREIDVWVRMDTIFAGRNDQTVSVMYFPDGRDSGNGAAVFSDFSGVWHMERDGGIFPGPRTVPDASGNNRTGVFFGFSAPMSVAGVVGNATAISTDRYINVDNSQSIFTDEPFMIETWVMVPAGLLLSEMWQPLVIKDNNSPFLELDRGNQVFRFGIRNAFPGTGFYCPADSTFQTDRWYHICGRYDGTTAELFVDGKKQSTSIIVNSVGVSNSSLQIGHYTGFPNRDFRGRIDEVRIVSDAKSDEWIRASYEGTNPDTRFFSVQKIQ